MLIECGIIGGICVNVGCVLFKIMICVVYIVYLCWESLFDGGIVVIMLII